MSDGTRYIKKCEICGVQQEYHKYHTYSSYCRYRKEIICVQCEKLCEEYREEVYPNGTHCRLSNMEETYKYQLIARPIPASPSEYEHLISNYENIPVGILHRRFVEHSHKYKTAKTAEYRAKLRNEMAAMQAVLRVKIMIHPIDRGMYERLGLGIGIEKRSE